MLVNKGLMEAWVKDLKNAEDKAWVGGVLQSPWAAIRGVRTAMETVLAFHEPDAIAVPEPGDLLGKIEAEVEEDRREQYGNVPAEAGRECAEVWTAMLRKFGGGEVIHSLTPRMVFLMKAADKLLRACPEDRFEDDDYVDARAYVKLAWEAGTEQKEVSCI